MWKVSAVMPSVIRHNDFEGGPEARCSGVCEVIEANVSNCLFAAHRLKVTRLKPPGQLKSCPNEA